MIGTLSISVSLRFLTIVTNASLLAWFSREMSNYDFNIWAFVSSATVFVLALDFGLSNYVRNSLVTSFSHTQFFTIFNFLLFNSLFVGASLSFLLFFDISWSDQMFYLLVSIGLLYLRVPFYIAIFGYFSFKEDFLYYTTEFLLAFCSSVISLAVFYLTSNLIYSIISYFLSGSIVAMLSYIYFINRRGWLCSFKFTTMNLLFLKDALSLSKSFFSLQVLSSLLHFLPLFLVSLYINLLDSALIRGVYILGQTILSFHLIWVFRFWRESTVLSHDIKTNQADIMVFKKKINVLHLEVLKLIAVFTLFYVFSPFVFDIWLNISQVDPFILFFLSLWLLGIGICNVYSMFFNGISKPSMISYSLIVGLVSAFLLVLVLFKFGILGISISFAFGSLISAFILYRKLSLFFAVSP